MWKFPSVLWLFLSFILSSAEIVLKYHNYEELTLKLQNLVAKYPDLLSLYNLSETSIQGMIPPKFCKPTFLHSMYSGGPNKRAARLFVCGKNFHPSHPY